jgi:hypothetical protein
VEVVNWDEMSTWFGLNGYGHPSEYDAGYSPWFEVRYNNSRCDGCGDWLTAGSDARYRNYGGHADLLCYSCGVPEPGES